ncbi:MAG: hypothetical protein R2730_14035 [Chitinophagales bacterium]
MEILEKISLGDAGRSSLHNNRVTRERALGKYFKPSNIDLGDHTKTKKPSYEAPTKEQLERLEKAEELRLKKEKIVLGIGAAIALLAVVLVFSWLS